MLTIQIQDCELLVSCARLHSHAPAVLAQTLHVSKASAVGGRAGTVKNSDGVVNVKLSLPKSLGGEGVQPGTTTPEDLFAAGYAACFGGAAGLAAKNLKLSPTKLQIDCSASVGRTADKKLGLAVELHGHFAGVSQQEANNIMQTAHQICPYSHATRDNIEVTLKATVDKQ